DYYCQVWDSSSYIRVF
nr:immunoglobulin light chain junction region [Macaca mulatta]